MITLAWTIIGFFAGSIPFSLLIGRLAGERDIRRYGDHNPGAFNVLRAVGGRWFFLAMILDGFKGAIPVGIVWYALRINDWGIIPVALAPVLGHAYSPWLRFRGGKSVAVTFGIWAGLSFGAGPVVLGMLLGFFYALLDSSGWAMMLAFGLFGVFIIGYYGPVFPQWSMIWLLNWVILAWKHREELYQRPLFRSWLKRLIEKQK